MFDKLKVLSKSSSTPPKADPAAPAGQAPGKAEIYQSRFNFGVNFGGVFVLEKWLYGDLFIDGTDVELDAVKAQIKKNGKDKTREALESHWKNYMNDQDWEWLASKGVKAVRIPIGYWEVDGGSFTKGTNFSSVAEVYSNAWDIYKGYIEKAAQYDIGVLIDLHGLPNGANESDHSGEKLKKAGFWESSTSINLAVKACEFIAHQVTKFENVVGLQIVNEAEFSNDAKHQKRYYTAAISAIRNVNRRIPVVISDGWWPNQWCEWLDKEEKAANGSLGVVIDSHVYRCFSDSDKAKSPEQLTADLNGDVLTNLSCQKDFICGEYSCVMDGKSFECGCDDRNKAVKAYGNELCRVLNVRASAGTYFWTYKFQWGDGGEWGFKPMLESGCIKAPPQSVSLPSKKDFEKVLSSKFDAHADYWDKQNSKEKYEHDRFKDGFITAWSDSLEFAKFNASMIGRVVAWKEARKNEHVKAKGESKHVWEWETGFQAGIDEFKHMVFGV